ncbi:hypothetical protein KKA53_02705 [Candidatus Dependentiae bacterium]|nr:hypothetical protein [Candidatus Dependentiae bacterium]
MNKTLKALAVLLFAGSVFTCCIADDTDCGCKSEEEKQEEVKTVLETVIEEEACEKAE